MKKTITLLLALALVMSLLTSCELMVPGPTQRPSIGLPAETAGTGEPSPTETSDPTVENYGFTVFPEGNYLANPKFDTEEYLPEYDSDPSFTQWLMTASSSWGLCRTDDTVYFLRRVNPRTAPYIYIGYMDKATGISGPLCGKPECTHRDSSCSAYVTTFNGGLCVYGGKLYWIENSALTRSNLDGTGREVLGGVSLNGTNTSLVIHRGYAYFAGTKETVENGEAFVTAVVRAYPLDGGETVNILEKRLDGTSGHCQIRLVGNGLYVMVRSYPAEDTQLLDFYRWDCKTRQVEELASLNNSLSEDGLRFGYQNFWPVPGDGIYFNSFYLEGVGRERASKYSFVTGEVEEVPSPFIVYVWFTSEFIIERNRGTVYAYDYDGNLVFTKETGHPLLSAMGADDEFIYFLCEDALAGIDAYYIAIPLDGGDVIMID